MQNNDNFSVTHLPLSKDACSCGVCFARNTPTLDKPGAEIYEIRIGHTVMRLCGDCIEKLAGKINAAAGTGKEGGA